MALDLFMGSWMCATATGQSPTGEGTFDPRTLPPFTDGSPYLGRYETGLYPGGSNEMPPAHRAAGEQIATMIRPLASDGQPDPQAGYILGLVMGHSNCRMYFDALQSHFSEQAPQLHPRFKLLNAAVGGQQLPQIVQLEGPVWDRAQQLAREPGRSPHQVQVLFLHTTYHGARNAEGTPPGAFPETMQQMQRDLIKVLEHCIQVYRSLKIAYLACDGLRHYTGYEPHVYQEAFALKWLIESQIKGEPGTAYQGDGRRLPWLEWGPYIWENAWDASYFTDGVHPAPKAQRLFAEKYWQHLTHDSVARPWLLRP
jgi:hypothetical protein